MHQSMSASLCSGKTIISSGLGVECIQPSVDVSGNLCISSSCTNLSSVVHVSSGTCHKSIQTFYSGGIMFDGGSLASHHFQHVGRHSSLVCHHKDLIMDVSVGQVLNGLPLLPLTHWMLNMCVVQTRVLFLSLLGSHRGNSNIYSKRLSAVFERMGSLVCLRGCTKQCFFCP